MLRRVVVKPTRACNASCSFCIGRESLSHAERMPVAVARAMIERLLPITDSDTRWIWHGGEPTLMGPAFYEEVHRYARTVGRGNFTLQTNLIGISENWRRVLTDCFTGISTSFDPETPALYRSLNGNSVTYRRRFLSNLGWVSANVPIKTNIVTTVAPSSAAGLGAVYDIAKQYGCTLRLNVLKDGAVPTRGPVSRIGEAFLRLYERWLDDGKPIHVSPFSDMVECPMDGGCFGKDLTVLPDGSAFSCSCLAYGQVDPMANIWDTEPVELVSRMMQSPSGKFIAEFAVKLPDECLACAAFAVCRGGCAADNVGISGKWVLCDAYRPVATRMVE